MNDAAVRDPRIGRDFLLGVNLPWQLYGCDFGANAWQPDGGVATPSRRRQMNETLAQLAGAGVRYVRWFLLCDGRAGVRWHGDRPDGLDGHVFRDLDAALDSLAEHRLQAMFALFDFHMIRRARLVSGVQLGGRRGVVISDGERARLQYTVVAPILERYGTHPVVFAWDLINEPEWATRGMGTRTRGTGTRTRGTRTRTSITLTGMSTRTRRSHPPAAATEKDLSGPRAAVHRPRLPCRASCP